MKNEAFRALWDLFDAMTIPALRGPLSHVSYHVKAATGVGFHPATWQTLAALIIACGGYWLYVFIHGAKS